MDATVIFCSASVALCSLRAIARDSCGERQTEGERERANKQVMCSVTCMLIAIIGYAFSMLPVRAHTDAQSHTHTQASNNNSLIGQRASCAMAAILIMLNVSK